MDVDRKHRRLLARLAATSRKRKRDAAIFDLTCNTRSAPTLTASSDGVVESYRVQHQTAGSSLHYGAQRGADPSAVSHEAAQTPDCFHGAAPPAARESCYDDMSVQSDCTHLYPNLCAHLAQEQQCAQTVAAAAEVNMPRASSYQQLQIQTSTADHYAANHDSFRMLSNAMASRPAAYLYPPGPLRRSEQPPSQPSIHSKLVSQGQRAAPSKPAAPQAVEQGRPDSFTAEEAQSLGRALQTPQRKAKASGPFFPTNLWPAALGTPHSLRSESVNPSIPCTAGSAGTRALAGDTRAVAPPAPSPAPNQPASMPWVHDPRLHSALKIPLGLPAIASLPGLPKPPTPAAAQARHPSLTPPQLVPDYSQFLADCFSAQDPPTVPVHPRPTGRVLAVPTPPGDARSDDSVAITHGRRQTWDWTHGPLYSFRALCQSQQHRQLQRQQHQQQLLIACHRHLHRSAQVDSSRTQLSEAQQKLEKARPVQMPKRSSMSSLSSQQPSLSHVTHVEACTRTRSSSSPIPLHLWFTLAS